MEKSQWEAAETSEPDAEMALANIDDEKLLHQCLENSMFKNYISYENLPLNKDVLDLCAQAEKTYKEFLLTNNKETNDFAYSMLFTSLVVDSTNPNHVTKGLFASKVRSNEYDLTLLDFADHSNIKATHYGLVSLETKDSIDKYVKLQQFYQNRTDQIASTFGIDLSDYYKASTSYDPAYRKADLVLLQSALKDSLKGIDLYENFNTQPIYLVNKDYSGGVILNSNENGMQFLHRFSILPTEKGKGRFVITETKKKSGSPIILPDFKTL